METNRPFVLSAALATVTLLTCSGKAARTRAVFHLARSWSGRLSLSGVASLPRPPLAVRAGNGPLWG
eukprot:10371329-Lingulodinium_polyedra.AAC.1